MTLMNTQTFENHNFEGREVVKQRNVYDFNQGNPDAPDRHILPTL